MASLAALGVPMVLDFMTARGEADEVQAGRGSLSTSFLVSSPVDLEASRTDEAGAVRRRRTREVGRVAPVLRSALSVGLSLMEARGPISSAKGSQSVFNSPY